MPDLQESTITERFQPIVKSVVCVDVEGCIVGLVESLGKNDTASIKTCCSTIAFVLEDKGDYKL
jgi:hypothetical protein